MSRNRMVSRLGIVFLILMLSTTTALAQDGGNGEPAPGDAQPGQAPTPRPGSDAPARPTRPERTPFTLPGSPSDSAIEPLVLGPMLGTNLVAVTASSLYRLEFTNGDATFIGTSGYSDLTDVAWLGSELYAVTFSQLLRLNPSTGQATLVGTTGFSINALAGSPGGQLYAGTTNGQLVLINPYTGVGTLIGNLPYSTAGDLVFHQGRLLATTSGSPNYLMEINPGNASAVLIGSTGYNSVFGLASVDGSLYGATSSGQWISIDAATGVGYYLGDSDLTWMGATANPVYNTYDDIAYAYPLVEPPANGFANQFLDTSAYEATRGSGDPDMGCGAGANSSSVWFSFDPSYYGKLHLATYSTLDPAANSDYDTVIAVYRGRPGSLTWLGCNDDAVGVQSDLSVNVEPGQHYYIEVAAYGSGMANLLSLFYNYDVAPKEWTLMFYTAGDNDPNQANRLWEQYSRLPDSANNLFVNIVGLWEDSGTESYYDEFTPWGWDWSTIDDVNTGDPNTLVDFIDWAVNAYPAEHYALIISDHGHGISGSAVDNADQAGPTDLLTPRELQTALNDPAVPYLDILYMDACLMATIDSGYQIRGRVDYYVASEAVTWGWIQPNWFITGFQQIPSISDETTGFDLSTAMARSYVAFRGFDTTPGTISVAYIPNVESLAAQVSSLAQALRGRMLQEFWTINGIRSDVQRYEENGDMVIDAWDRLIDLDHFALLVAERIENETIQSAAQGVVSAINNYIVFNQRWSGAPNGGSNFWLHNDSYGVSAIFPSPLRLACYYNGDWLDFAGGSYWNCAQAALQLPGGQSFVPAPSSSAETFEWGPMLVDFTLMYDPGATADYQLPDLVGPLPPPAPNFYLMLPMVVR